MRILFSLSFTLLISISGATQPRCGSAEYVHNLMLTDPSFREQRQRVEGFTTARLREQPVFESSANQPDAARVITIPVVVHVIYHAAEENISEDQIRSQIESLNADFSKTNNDFSHVPAVFAAIAANVGIHFVLASSDPEGRATNGIIRKKSSRMYWSDDDKVKLESEGGSAAWDSRYYINFWVCNTPSGLLGYGSFPGGAPEKDGIVVNWGVFGTRGTLHSPYNLGRTATHEVGHWLNLIHIWGDTNCGDDQVKDTPRQKTHNSGNPSFPHLNAGCDNCVNGDMFMNYMDFSDDASLNMFTIGQRERMLALFTEGGPRASILQSTGLATPWNNSIASPASISASLVRIYPNPAIGSSVTLSTDAVFAGKTYVIYAADGRAVQSGLVTGASQVIQLQSLKAGIYFVRVGDGKVAGKFIRN